MPARTRKRKASEEEDATPEIVPAVKKKSLAPRKSRKSSQEQPSKAGKSSKKGRAGTGETLNHTRASKKTKSAASRVSTVKRDIRRKADELIHLIDNQYASSRSKDGLGNVGATATVIESKMAVLSKDAIGLRLEPTDRNFDTIYRASYQSLQNLQEAMDEYERVNGTATTIAKPTYGQQWEQDAKDIGRVDTKAMEILQQTLNGMILSGKNVDVRSPVRSGDEVEQAAWRWLQAGLPVKEDTWGDAAREAFEALSGVAKLFS